mgnify:CR=1 FL=1|jgi:hypothetical protein
MTKMLSSNKSFGFLLFITLIIIHFVFYKFKFSIILIFSAIILALSLLKPEIFEYPNKFWIKFGLILGKILNPVVCTVLYFVAVGVTKLFLDLFNKKLMLKKSNPKVNTYWIIRDDNLYKNFDNQF